MCRRDTFRSHGDASSSGLGLCDGIPYKWEVYNLGNVTQQPCVLSCTWEGHVGTVKAWEDKSGNTDRF